MEIVLDLGSGNSCRNNPQRVADTIHAVKNADNGKHTIILKWQIFKKAGINIPLDEVCFWKAYGLAAELGYKTTASVFDRESLKFLLNFDVPFVKIANDRSLDYLIGEIPRRLPVYYSISSVNESKRPRELIYLACVSKYPANLIDYIPLMGLCPGLSDHTVGTELVKMWRPEIFEKHFVLERSDDNPDGGPFAITPAELKEFLEEYDK